MVWVMRELCGSGVEELLARWVLCLRSFFFEVV
jgi:hypothetical protein